MKTAVTLGGFLLFLTIWFAFAEFAVLGKTILASPLEVYTVMFKTPYDDQNIYNHVYQTLSEALHGLLISVLIGTLVGFLFGLNRHISSILEPILEIIRAVPPVALFHLFLAGFNNSVEAYTWIIVYGCTPIVIIAVSRRVLEAVKLRADLQLYYPLPIGIRCITVFMDTLPGILLGSRIALSIAIVVSVVSEMIVAPNRSLSLGNELVNASMTFDTPTYYALIFMIGIFGYIANFILVKLEAFIGFR
ncbi:ABC transporter permease [Alteromonas lipotrueae]|uniref:ABC transporter permease n=1 Tax=Alteromonas lipotrueae TaxID=2803814 RepID=UPI001C45CC6E|nr:hypothetical protein [Alteromonas lipotrueae]